MRLINADAVKAALRNRISENIDECINNVPTVDVLEQIRDEIEHEADYQNAYVNADIAKGMYLALEIFDKYKSGDNK